MTSSVPNPLRGLRAAVFGTCALLLAVAAHAAAGGPLPDPVTIAGIGLPLACASVVLARRRRGYPGIAICLAGAEVLLHEALMLAAASPSCASVAASGGAAAHAMPGMSAASCAAGAMPSMLPSPAMLVTHALATVATALLLAHGEATLGRLADWVGIRPRIAIPLAAPRARAVVIARVVTPVVATRRTGTVSRRGPPRPHAVLTSFA